MALDRSRLNAAMRRLADGDRDAFAEVYAGVTPVARRVAAVMLHATPADIDDVVQQALMKLFANASRFEPEGDVTRWMVAITGWECRTARRRHVRFSGRNEPLPPHLESAEQTPEGQVIHAQLLDTLRDVVGELSARDRELLTRTLSGSPRDRKRRERATSFVRSLWRKRHGNI